jgi:hypothetical protein
MPIQFVTDASQATRGLFSVADFADLARRPIRAALRETAQDVMVDAKASMPDRGGRPSRPGETPTRQTGKLVAALMTKQPASRRNAERAYVTTPPGDEYRYAWMLESGFPRIGGPRPFLVPARQRHVADFVTRVEAALEEAARQTNRR